MQPTIKRYVFLFLPKLQLVEPLIRLEPELVPVLEYTRQLLTAVPTSSIAVFVAFL